MAKLTNIPNPLPQKPDKFMYWLAAAVAGAFMGGVVFNALSKKDPL